MIEELSKRRGTEEIKIAELYRQIASAMDERSLPRSQKALYAPA